MDDLINRITQLEKFIDKLDHNNNKRQRRSAQIRQLNSHEIK